MSAQEKIEKLTDAIRYSRNIHGGYANSFGEFACDIWEYLTLSKVALTELRAPDTVDRQLEVTVWDSPGFNVIEGGCGLTEVVSTGVVSLSADGLRGLARDLLSAAETMDGIV